MTYLYRFAHLSDPHLTSLGGVNFRSLLNKRVMGYISWRISRRFEHLPEVLAALVADLHAQSPQHTLVTGDLTHIGLPEECAHVAAWLDRLGSSEDVTVVPGNHDTYVRAPWADTVGRWEAYMRADKAPFASDGGLFPSLRIRGPLAFVGLSCARPTPPFFASGTLGREQLKRLDELLVGLRDRGLIRIILLHHPPVSGTVGWRKRLTDGDAFCHVVERRGAELVLHGHSHRSDVRQLNGRDGLVPVLGVRSASAIGTKSGHAAQYHIYHVANDGDSGVLDILTREYSIASGGFITQGRQRLKLATPSQGGFDAND